MPKQAPVSFVVTFRKDVAAEEAERILDTFSRKVKWNVLDLSLGKEKLIHAFGNCSKACFEELFDASLEWRVSEANRAVRRPIDTIDWRLASAVKIPKSLPKVTRISLSGKKYPAARMTARKTG